MKLIDTEKLRKVTEARKIINDLQARLLAREQALDDLSRSIEIARFTNQYQLVDSFRQAAEEQLVDRLEIPAVGENTDLKLRIYE
jgi:hypothetical protein